MKYGRQSQMAKILPLEDITLPPEDSFAGLEDTI